MSIGNIKFDKIYLNHDFRTLIEIYTKHESNATLVVKDKEQRKFLSHIEKGVVEKMLSSQIALKNFSESITPVTHLFSLEDKIIEFSDSPYANLCELFRKLDIKVEGKLFQNEDEDKFNELAHDLFQEVISFVAKGEVLHDQLLALSRRHHIIYHYLAPLLNFLEANSPLARSFYHALQVSYQKNFSAIYNEPLGIYLLVSVIAPYYELNEALFLQKMQVDHHESNIHYMEKDYLSLESTGRKLICSIKDGTEIDFNEAILLNHSKQLYYKSLKNYSVFRKLQFTIDLSNFPLEQLHNKKICFNDYHSLGGNFPHYETYLSQDNQLFVDFYYQRKEGAKEEFFFAEALKLSYQGFKLFCGDLAFDYWKERATLTKSDSSFYVQFDRASSIYELKKSILNSDNESLKNVSAYPYQFESMGKTLALYHLLRP